MIEAETIISDHILQAAMEIAKESLPDRFTSSGTKNAALLQLIDDMLGAIEPVANAVADNAWDDCIPVHSTDAKVLTDALHRLADVITTSAAAPNKTDWSLPSMTGKELV